MFLKSMGVSRTIYLYKHEEDCPESLADWRSKSPRSKMEGPGKGPPLTKCVSGAHSKSFACLAGLVGEGAPGNSLQETEYCLKLKIIRSMINMGH